MGFLVSPGVHVKEIDLTNVVPSVDTTIGAIAGPFEKGPVSSITHITSEADLLKNFGKPNADNFEFYINPQIDQTYKKSIQEEEEGCLSIPEIRLVTERYDKIKVRYFNRDGKKIKKPLSGFMSRVFQHELDHLDGKLMVENNKIKNVYRISENENIQTLYSNLVKKLSSF